MKNVHVELSGELTAQIPSVKVIGGIGNRDSTLCLLSEKNLKNVLNTLGTIPASDLAMNIAQRLRSASEVKDFNSKVLQDILNDELEFVYFAVDCGELLIGDDSKIKEYLSEHGPTRV